MQQANSESTERPAEPSATTQAAAALGRRRMASMTPEQRSEFARKGAAARWDRVAQRSI